MNMNREARDEMEMMIKDELDRRQEEKRWRDLRGNNFDDTDDKKGGSFIKLPCCLVILVALAFAITLIYYVYVRVREPIVKEWQDNKEFIEQVPQKVEDLKNTTQDKIETGKVMLNEANYTIENLEQKIDSAKNAYNKAAEITQDLQDLSGYTKKALE